MKRDLAFALDVGSQLADSVGVNRAIPSGSGASSCTGEADDANRKRIRVTEVNGYIVYTRLRKHRSKNGVELFGSVENERIKSSEEAKINAVKTVLEDSFVVKNAVEGSQVIENVIQERQLQDSAIEEKTVAEERLVVEAMSDERPMVKTVIEESQLIDILIVEECPSMKSGIEGSIVVESIDEETLVVQSLIEDGNMECKEEPMSESRWLSAKDGVEGAMAVAAEGDMAKINLLGKTLRRFTRPVFHPKEEPMSAPGAVENEAVSHLDVEATEEGAALTTLKKNLELKMSKKIALNKKPTTVKELFETGLLEGVTVVYMGGNKPSGLRGTIKDAGILCSCSYCKGCRVIPPSQFEIHACKQYRRASQYICFENGKSLLDVMRACRNSPLHTLEATLQSALSSSPAEKLFFCRRCKGSFPITCVGRVGPLCNSCVDSKKSEGSSNCAVSISAGSPEPVVISKSSTSTPTCIPTENRRQRKISRRSLESHLSSKSPKSASDSVSSQHKRLLKRPRKSLNHDFGLKSSKSDSMHLSSQNKHRWKITKKRPKEVSISRPLTSASLGISLQNKSQWKITTKDQRLHRLVFEKGGLPDGTEVAYYARGKKLLEGYKKGFGILCCCCNCEVSPSQFEAHAGWASRRKPYAYIYTSNGVSLHELAISLSKGRKYSAKDNDDLCIICADGGNLLLCDGCPRAFHRDCASLSNIPRGDWYCKYCQNVFEREKFAEHNANALAAGRVSGVDPIEEINRRCIRIVKNIEAELSGCVLCRAYDFSKSGFNPRTILLCDQCEREYHVGCLKTHKMADLKELPKGKWFCCMDCSSIHSTLQKLVVRGAEKLPDHLLNAITKKHEEKGLDISNGIDVNWRLLSGKIASPETRFLLAQAVAIFHECFDPIIDSFSGRDLIPSMVYGRNSRGHEYGGMYCAILIVNSSVVSAAILRVFGQDFAELPLVATSKVNHGKGYFQMLFSCIEKLLASLNVRSLVLPAAEEAESIWTDKFGFNTLNPEQLSRYRRSCCQMVTFKGTSMLQKTVPAFGLLNRSTESTDSSGEAEQENQFLA